jgi:hypothetical protein
MSSADSLQGFAYGEELDGPSGRSLGFRLLAPAGPAPWREEVEGLARLLQAAPYPAHWPPADLFCSVLLATGQRLVALARYGRGDHTPSHRRGGLELIGVVAPPGLEVSAALGIYRWLQGWRGRAEDLRQFAGLPSFQAIAKVPAKAAEESRPLLPVRLWRPGVVLFAASSPQAPDRALGLLEDAVSSWQWLPLCGPEFPLQEQARRGPVVAWTAEPIDLALQLPPAAAAPSPVSAPGRRLATALALTLLLLLAANLWALWTLPGRLDLPRPLPAAARQGETVRAAPQHSGKGEKEGREEVAQALYGLLERAGASELTSAGDALLAHYEHLAARDEALRVAGTKGRTAIAVVSVLAGRSADRVAQDIREEFRDRKGYDPELIRLISERVRQRLIAQVGQEAR